MKIKIASIGCRLNQAEIQSVITGLHERGHELTVNDDADVIIINSCVVTVTSARKTRKLIYQAERALQSRKEGRILITGCAAPEVRQEGKHVFIPNDYKYLIPDIVEDRNLVHRLHQCTPSRFEYPVPLRGTRTRVNLKIQDGCDNRCAYCIVPFVRGRSQSKPLHRIVSEFEELIEAGFKEIVLTGVMIGNYENEGCRLADLLDRLLAHDGQFRIHLSSLAPQYMTSELRELMTAEKIVKHLHLSLQSGSNRILKSMNRFYTREEYLRLCESVRSSLPKINLTTDVIVGFPGETEDDFRETMDLIRSVAFSHVHTFRYSPRPDTKAAAMEETVSEITKTERSSEIRTLYTEQKRTYYRRFEHRETVFLSERFRKGMTRGFNEYYVPVEIDRKLERNQFYRVKTVLDEERLCLRGIIG